MLWHPPVHIGADAIDNQTFLETGQSCCVTKILKCPREKWKDMWKILEPMRADFEFTSNAAAEVNSLLEVPLLRA